MRPERLISRPAAVYQIDIDAVCSLIANAQRKTGEIPWCENQKTDPWDHIEAAMGLSIGGCLSQAQRAYTWLARMQLEDGSWYSAYMHGQPLDKTRAKPSKQDSGLIFQMPTRLKSTAGSMNSSSGLVGVSATVDLSALAVFLTMVGSIPRSSLYRLSL